MKFKVPKIKLTIKKKNKADIEKAKPAIFGKIKSFFIAVGEGFKEFGQTKAFSIIKKVFAIIFMIFTLAVIVFGVMIYGFKKSDKVTRVAAKVVPYPVAIVNTDFITYNDYLNEKDYIHHFYQATNQSEIDYAEIDKQIYDQLIENKAIEIEASKLHVKVKKEDVDSAINTIIEQNGGQDKVEKVLDELYGLNLKQFKKLVRIQLLRDQVNEQVIAKVTASHILIRVDKDATQDKVDAAKTKIDGILKEVQGGLDFAEAAKKYSEDTGSAEQGGQLDPFAQGEMVDEFSKTAFETPVGQISAPVRTEFGWHIIKVEAKTGTVEKKFADWIADLAKGDFVKRLIKF